MSYIGTNDTIIKNVFPFFCFRYINPVKICTCKKVIIMEIKTLNDKVLTSRQIYAELLCDFMFKRLFGSEANKDVLIGFLNMLLEDVEIVDVEFIPTEHLGLT